MGQIAQPQFHTRLPFFEQSPYATPCVFAHHAMINRRPGGNKGGHARRMFCPCNPATCPRAVPTWTTSCATPVYACDRACLEMLCADRATPGPQTPKWVGRAISEQFEGCFLVGIESPSCWAVARSASPCEGSRCSGHRHIKRKGWSWPRAGRGSKFPARGQKAQIAGTPRRVAQGRRPWVSCRDSSGF